MKQKQNNAKEGTEAALAPSSSIQDTPVPKVAGLAPRTFLLLFLVLGFINAGCLILFFTHRTAISSLQKDIGALSQAVQHFKKDLADIPTTFSAASVPAEIPSSQDFAPSALKNLEERLLKVEQNIAHPPSASRDSIGGLKEGLARLQALKRLKAALRTHRPFITSLSAVTEKLKPLTQEDQALFKKLSEIAVSGAPTVRELEKTFYEQVLPALQPAPSTTWERAKTHFWNKFSSLIKLYNDSPEDEIGGPIETLSRIIFALKEEDLETALSLLREKYPLSSSPLRHWQENAERRVFIEKSYLLLKAYILEAMAAPPSNAANQSSNSSVQHEVK